MSKQAVARKSGIHAQSVGKIESGHTRVLKTKTRQGLAYALEIPEAHLDAAAKGISVEETGALDVATVGPTKPIAVTNPDNAGLMVVASKSHRDQATDDYIAKYNVRDMTSAGSSLKFCLVATGEADLYPRLGRTMEWDTAAGHAVLNGAGGQVVRFDDHTPLGYGKNIFENPFFIALAPGVDLKPA